MQGINLLQFANSNITTTEEERAEIIKNATIAYESFLDALRIDWRNDPNSKDTPMRVAKSFVNDLISGCYLPSPNITDFDNIDKYDGMVFVGNIDMKSLCAHHHLTFYGHAHVAYLPGNVQIGLSKLNRIVEWFSRRPQSQENLTMLIHNYINSVCTGNTGVAVLIEAKHLCACVRGVRHNSTMITSKFSGAFINDLETRKEFHDNISFLK